ncbi:sodium:proton antiporter [Lentilactobacillus diolivorans]|uniref:cation:proton antiporter n=1 Tax=Lentilactobacillus diolivorans TaxID=179838 RepID=UPI002468F523|nr:sodium:proton antiporter [Lentilactobacillus diolivorans]MDH5106853.1 sodium:proton antiporter [Lentilactobacillus diolivorans]
MEIFYSVALLIVAAIISNIIYTGFPKIPLTFYQIGCGLLLSLFPVFQNYSLYPEIFMVGIIAPLMFNDGRNTSSAQFGRSLRHIFSMAIFLAIITAVLIGGLTHALMPLIPLTLCFALAAIVTPTDSMAFKSITEPVELPKNISGILESESLFNDASGIVIFNLALGSFVTGDFSFTKGLTSFIISFFGGLLVGLIAGIGFVRLQTFLVERSMDTSSVIVPFSLMTPFAIYLISETLGCSGILAVVAAGIIYGINQSRLKLTSTNVRLVTSATWNIVTSLLNGIVFVLLGVTLPSVIVHIIPYSNQLIVELFLIGIAIYLAMAIIRFLWVKCNFVKTGNHSATNQEAFLTAIGGVHGTITLSMALSLPLTLYRQRFPFRSELIFVATIVILLSLIIPSLMLPHLLPRKNKGDQSTFNHHRTEMVNYSIAKVKDRQSIPLVDRNYVIDMLTSQKSGQSASRQQIKTILSQTREVEVQTVLYLLSNGQIPQQIANVISRRLVTTPSNAGGFFKRLKYFWLIHLPNRKRRLATKKRQSFMARFSPEQNRKIIQKRDQFRKIIEDNTYQRVNDYLDKIETPDNSAAVAFVKNGYNFRHMRIDDSDASNDRQNQLLIEAFQYEYSYVADALRNKTISREVSDQLNQSISTDQMVYVTNG